MGKSALKQQYSRAYYLAHKEAIIARTSAYQKKHHKLRAKYKRNWHLLRQYNIDQETYNLLHKRQKGVCAICKQTESKINSKTKKLQPLCVDHDHKTGKVRGLLWL